MTATEHPCCVVPAAACFLLPTETVPWPTRQAPNERIDLTPSRAEHRVLFDYFWKHVDTHRGPDSCWPWVGIRRPDGYGVCPYFYSHRDIYREVSTHRQAMRFSMMAVPVGYMVMHSCDNPPCCNPRHLRFGTAKDNAADRLSRGRQRSILTAESVRDIRARIGSGETISSIARGYSVRYTAIWNAYKGKTWKHVS